MAHPLEEDLTALTVALEEHSEATRIEWERAIREGHTWTEQQHRDFISAFNAASEHFLRLLEKKRHIQHEIRASKT
jgi:hypothetical protein